MEGATPELCPPWEPHWDRGMVTEGWRCSQRQRGGGGGGRGMEGLGDAALTARLAGQS